MLRSATPLLRLACVAMLASTGCSSNGDEGAPTSATSDAPSASSRPQGHLVWGYWDAEDNLHMSTANADGTNTRPLLPDLGWLGAPNWSPDGQQLALYVVGSGSAPTPSHPNDGRVTGGLVNADGTGFHAFESPDPTLNAACFEWSPDGDRLACEGFDDTHPARDGLYTVRAMDGRDLQPVTTHHRVGLCSYSPDGSRIAYLEDDQSLTVVNVDGTGKLRISDMTFGPGCDWSPDGRTILAASDGSLWLIGLDGTTTEIPVQGGLSNSYGPAFSPDGSHIVFMAATDGELFDVYTMRLDGSELDQITDTPEEEDYAEWGV